MRQSLEDFKKEEIYLIRKLWNDCYTIEEISQLTDFSFYEIAFVLRKVDNFFPEEENISFTSFNEKKIMFLSDTHLGSIHENMDYIEQAYQYAKQYDIHTVIHGGDLIQSMISNVSSKYSSHLSQVYHVVDDYPYFSDIKTYILFGNHDYYTFKTDPSYLSLLKERDDFTIFGFKRAYFTWNKKLFSLGHPIKKYHLPISKVDSFVNIMGHSHKLSKYKNKSLMLPTLSDDLAMHKKEVRPGFLIGNYKKNEFSFSSFLFKKELEEEKNVFVKKI